MSEQQDKALGVLDRILSYVDSPFKLIALLIMFVFGFCAWFVYANQELLVGAYKESQKLPTINEARVEDAASMLIKYGGAHTVTVFKVNPLFGTRVLYRAFSFEGHSSTLPVFLHQQNSGSFENAKPSSAHRSAL